MGLILNSKDVIPKAVEELRKLQSGEEKPIITRYGHLNTNSAGGLLTKNIFIMAGASGCGKSYTLQTIEEDFLNPKLNPEAKEHLLIRCNWEMIARSLLIRAIRREIDIPLKDIYYAIKTEEQKQKMKEIAAREMSDNIFYMPTAVTPEVFKEAIREFCLEHPTAKKIMVSIDHIGLTIGSDKFITMNRMIEVMNQLKLDPICDKVIICGVMQLNREIEKRTNYQYLAPIRSDLYGADMVYQTADFVVVLNRPAKLFHTKYMQISPDSYPHLKHHMQKPEAKSTWFKTEGKMFWHYLKLRDEDETMSNIAIETISKTALQKIEADALINPTILDKFNEDEDERMPF